MSNMKAINVINKFGGAYQLAEAIGVSHVSVYRWTYPPEKGGSGGWVPAHNIDNILKVAKEKGIDMSEYEH